MMTTMVTMTHSFLEDIAGCLARDPKLRFLLGPAARGMRNKVGPWGK